MVPNWESHLNPPVDPWGQSEPPTVPARGEPARPAPPPMYGRAPVPAAPLREPTAEMPALVGGRGTRPGPPRVSWQRSSRASLRSLADGWGFTAAGLIATFCGWGLWAAAGRGTDLQPLPGLILTLIVGAGVFTIARVVGYLLVGRMLGRPRLHARWSHFATFVFLTMAGGAYLLSTSWITDADDWIRRALDWLAGWWGQL